MAAYPYYPQYTNPYSVVYPNAYQPQAAQQQTPSTSGIIWVSGLQEAQMFPVAPNNAVALWEQSGKTVYLKQADATGKPTIKVFDLVERNSTAEKEDKPADEYARKSDLVSFAEVISAMKNDIDSMKSDIYGIAGKKKSKKAEVIEDDE